MLTIIRKPMLLALSTLLLSMYFFCTVSFSQTFNNPESAAYDSQTGNYYISNFGEGSIIRIDKLGKKKYYQTGYNKFLGLVIKDRILYAVNNPRSIIGFDLNTNEEISNLTISDAIFLNDITFDDKIFMYQTADRV